MKKIIPKIFITFWLLLFIALGAYYIKAPKESTFSEEENRKLAAMPEFNKDNVLSGKFGEEFETYLLDRFPKRYSVISKTNILQNLISFATYEEYILIAGKPSDPLDSDKYKDDIGDLIGSLFPTPTHTATALPHTPPTSTAEAPSLPPSVTPTATVPSQPTEYPPIEQKPPVSAENFPKNVGMYMEINNYRDSNLYALENVMAVTAVLNKYADLLPEGGKLMFTVVPQSIFANQFVNAKIKTSFYSDWDDVVNGFGRNNVYAFDSAEILSEAIKQEQYVFFRTDMHWTPYGSYLVYSEMAKRAGKTPSSYKNDFNLTVESPFRGTYYRDNPSAYMDVSPDTLDLLMPKIPLKWLRTISPDNYKLIDFLNFNAKKNDRYTVYLGGPAGPWTYAESENEQSENCLVMTDSFGLGFIPFLTPNYKQVHYYDPRYYSYDDVGYTVAEMIKKYNIQDIYVVVGDLHSFDSSFIMSYANKQLGSSLPD